MPDDALEHELRAAAARFDPVPAELLRRAVDGFSWRTIDAEYAELTFDSLVDTDTLLVRGAEESRLLTFRAGGLAIEVEVTATGASRSLVGQLLPPRPAILEIRNEAGTVTVEADDLGRFSGRSLPAGPTSLHCRPGHGHPAVVTGWISF
jgi:hypothetical protein